ncbi:MAG: MarC family protein [Bacteroidales bacterium]|nr:MarC family protein [Bacteroidales bacterium]
MLGLQFNLQEMFSAFMVLFVVIDLIGLTPILIDIQQKTGPINAAKASIFSLTLMLAFLFLGDLLLKFLNVDIQSFAVAGALVIFVMAIEMILGVEIFKFDGPKGSATLVPIVFPFIAGAGSFTTLLSIRAVYNVLNIVLAVILNVILVYIVLKKVTILERFLGKAGVYVMRKFFGIILLAISVKLFTTNIWSLIETLPVRP